MLDIKFVRENPDAIDVAMANRQTSWDREKFFELDDERRAVITEVEELQATRNAESKKIGALMKEGKKEEAEAAKAEELHFTDGTTSAQDIVTEATGGANVNSWFVDQVLRDVSADLADLYGITEKEALNRIYNSGYNIYTTLDPKIQEIAESVYEDRGSLNNLTSASGQLIHSGITIIEPSTGNIVAMVGDMGPKSGNLLWNYATDIQQPGSSIKPLTA